jgi:hypothetical protein
MPKYAMVLDIHSCKLLGGKFGGIDGRDAFQASVQVCFQAR